MRTSWEQRLGGVLLEVQLGSFEGKSQVKVKQCEDMQI
jgi:hypothetical protein